MEIGFKKTLKKIILGTGIILGIACSGCESTNGYDWMALATRGAMRDARTLEDVATLGLLENHFQTQANREDRRYVATKMNLSSKDPERDAHLNYILRDLSLIAEANQGIPTPYKRSISGINQGLDIYPKKNTSKLEMERKLKSGLAGNNDIISYKGVTYLNCEILENNPEGIKVKLPNDHKVLFKKNEVDYFIDVIRSDKV